MNQVKMTFSQILEFASQDIFKNIVKQYKGNYKTKEFSKMLLVVMVPEIAANAFNA